MGNIENEKFKVGVPAEIYDALNRDAEQFGIYKDDSDQININGFLSRLIVGYYKKYKEERSEKTDRIMEMVGPWLKNSNKLGEITERIMSEIVLSPVPKRKGKNPGRLSITPTRDTDRIITEIKNNTKNKSSGSYTDYLCRMFMSYCEKPSYERERIIFRENTEFLLDACKKHKEIIFATANRRRKIQHAIAYDLVVGRDELNNYLLCQRFNEKSKKNEPVSYRLCRIIRPDYSDMPGMLDAKVVKHLELMKKRNPQYAIMEESDICVRLSPAGQKSYQQIYFARPEVDRERIEKLEDGYALYHFDVSQDMVFRFVIRFGPGEAEVIYPQELRDKVRKHFTESLVPYKNG